MARFVAWLICELLCRLTNNIQVENIRELFREDEPASEEEEEEESSPGAASSIPSAPEIHDHHSFVMGYSSSRVDLRPLHPLPSQIPFYWETFKDNVDPLCKVCLCHIFTLHSLTCG
jgi:hypothetical protein